MIVGDWTPSEKQPLASLHRRFVDSLDGLVMTELTDETANMKPLDLECCSPLPRLLRLYVFNCTDHPSERKAGDYRIQLRLPGQRRRQRGRLELDGDHLILLAGYIAEFTVFVLWDANAHADFPYSKGVQVGASTVHEAAIRGMGEQQRGVRSAGYEERVLAVRADKLVDGIQRREKLTLMSLLERPVPDVIWED